MLIKSTRTAASHSTLSYTPLFIQARLGLLCSVPLATVQLFLVQVHSSISDWLITKRQLENTSYCRNKVLWIGKSQFCTTEACWKSCILQWAHHNPAPTSTQAWVWFSTCLYFFFTLWPSYSWYCLSVAIKKSSITLLRYSKVGLSSGFSCQHILMTL